MAARVCSDLEAIANDHNHSRSVTLGYNASAAYIMERIAQDAPVYTVHQEFFTMGCVCSVASACGRGMLTGSCAWCVLLVLAALCNNW